MGLFGIIDDVLGTDLEGSKARGTAINAQNAATDKSVALQREMYAQQREDLAPWRETGARALSGLEGVLPESTRTFSQQDFQADPGYNFMLQQGNRAIQNAASARGGRASSRTLRDLVGYNQGLANQQYQNAYNRFNQDRDQKYNKYAALAGTGQTTAGQLANAAGNFGQSVSGLYTNQANAIGNAAISQSNQQSQLLGQGAGAAALAFSDARVKENIRPISKEDMAELSAAIKPYTFNYANDIYGDGDWVGVMAQDLEKTRLGKRLVVEDDNGVKMIDMRKVGSVLLASLGGE